MQSDVSYWNLIYKARLHDMFLQILLSFCFFCIYELFHLSGCEYFLMKI